MRRPGALEVRVSSTEADVGRCARLWALAVARRDDTRPDVDRATAGIERRLALPDAVLLVATVEGRLAGFAVMAPVGRQMELFHCAVDPGHWGHGVARRVLARVDEVARAMDADRLVLWVVDDNHRAIDLYRRAGWSDAGHRQHEPPGRPERQLSKVVEVPGSDLGD